MKSKVKKEKSELEQQLNDLKEENQTLQNQSTHNSSSHMSPEQYLDVLQEEKNLNEMLHFCQLVCAKYTHMHA